MIPYVLRRLGGLLLVVLGMSFIVFIVARTLPGDPARVALGDDAPAEAVAAYRTDLGLDRPLVLQYASYLRDLGRGDLGVSIISRRPVLADLAELRPATVELAVLSILVGVGLGIASVVLPNRVTVGLARGLPMLSLSIPTFWLGLMLQLVLYGKPETPSQDEALIGE